jgi:predicted transcriptional regulator
MPVTVEKELEILEYIHARKETVHQRDLAKIAGLSLGMTNAILRRLMEKGWLMIRKVNNRNIQYIVSPKGLEQITRKSYRYFKRTIKNVVYYREALENLVKNIRRDGYEGVVLVGKSDLDFIVEHACRREGIKFLKDESMEKSFGGRVYYIYSESYIPDAMNHLKKDTCFLQELFL